MYWDKMANFHGTLKKVEIIRKNLPKCPKNVEFVQKSAYRPGTLYCRFKFSWTTVHYKLYLYCCSSYFSTMYNNIVS